MHICIFMHCCCGVHEIKQQQQVSVNVWGIANIYLGIDASRNNGAYF